MVRDQASALAGSNARQYGPAHSVSPKLIAVRVYPDCGRTCSRAKIAL